MEKDLSADVRAIKGDLAELRKDLTTLTNGLVDRGVQKAGAMKASVEDAVESGVDTVRDTIQERPFTSLLVAVGAGMVLSRLLSRH